MNGKNKEGDCYLFAQPTSLKTKKNYLAVRYRSLFIAFLEAGKIPWAVDRALPV